MHRDMTQYHAVHDMVGSQLTKVLSVLVITEDVVVATNQYFVTVQSGQRGQCSTVDYHVAQMIHFV